MSRIAIVVAIAFFYSSLSFAANEGMASDGSQQTAANYQQDGTDGLKSIVLVDEYGQYKFETATSEETTLDDSLERKKRAPGTSVGLEVAPLFGNYGVFRTSIKKDQSAYLAIGFTADAIGLTENELIMDDADTLDNVDNSGLAYGFGVNSSSYNIEYMMYMDEENYGISAIGLGFISEF